MRLILLKASAAYPNQLELTQDTLDVWLERLENFPAEKALKNLNTHIDSSRFFPTIADIIKHDPEQFVDHEQQRLDTKERLAKISIVQPAVSDERIEEIRREVAAGLHDDKFKDDPYLGRRVIGD